MSTIRANENTISGPLIFYVSYAKSQVHPRAKKQATNYKEAPNDSYVTFGWFIDKPFVAVGSRF